MNIIHYCYFNKNNSLKLVNEYTESWIKYGFKPIIINENSFDVHKLNFTHLAYLDQKYAFVADVARLQHLYHQGGIYCDTDVRMVQKIDQFIKTDRLLLSFEYYEWELTGVNLGTIITPPRNPIIKEVLDIYSSLEYQADKTPTINELFNQVLIKRGLLMNNKTQTFEDFKVIPYQFFCKKSQNSFLIHEYKSSWQKKQSLAFKIRRYCGKKIKKIIGKEKFKKLWKN